MFGFGSKARQEKARKEAEEIGLKHVSYINDLLEKWTEAMAVRRAMIEDFFDERITAIEPTDGLTFEHVAELEALALTKNWLAGFDGLQDDFDAQLSSDSHGVIETLAMRSDVDGHLTRIFSEATDQLEAHVNETIHDAVVRRGEDPTPRE